MELKPVAHAKKPGYPDKYEIELDKTLLLHRPKSWLAKPIIGLTLSAIMAAGLTGCSADNLRGFIYGENGGDKEQTGQNGQTEDAGDGSNDENNDDNGWDEGIVMGGIKAWMPYYLTDHDALTVIADELSKSGFRLVSEHIEPSIPFFPNSEEGFVQDVPPNVPSPDAFEFDGHFMHGDNKINLEYVSMEDCESKKFSEAIAPNSYYDPSETAENLKTALPNAAIFHDPVTDWEPYTEEQLREQVIDFIEWLRAMGE